MDYWGGQCAVTEVKTPEFLVASHIKPWSECQNDDERLDLYNALLLNVSLDRAFDQGFLTFNNTGKILLSPLWSWNEANAMGIYSTMHLRRIEMKHTRYLEYHNEYIFKAKDSITYKYP